MRHGTGRAAAASAPTRILVVDDHPVVRSGLVAVIAQEPDLVVVGEAADGQGAVRRYEELRPDVVLMDIRMPVLDGVEASRLILAAHPDARILALTTYDGDGDIRRAFEAGARGYLLKEMLMPELLHAIRHVRAGRVVVPLAVERRLAAYPERSDLTEREMQVLQLVATGMTNKQVALALGRTDETVKIHLKNIFAKLHATDRTGAVTQAQSRGLIRL